MKSPFPMSTQLQAGCVLHLAYVPEKCCTNWIQNFNSKQCTSWGVRGLTVYNCNTNRHTDLQSICKLYIQHVYISILYTYIYIHSIYLFLMQ